MSIKRSQTETVPAPVPSKDRKDRMMSLLITDVLAARKVTPIKKAAKKKD